MRKEGVVSAGMSRRTLLHSVACATGAAGVLGTGINAARAAKISQASVGYQGSPKAGQSCATCRLFQAPNACRSVDGIISPEGWCKIWMRA